MEIKIKSRKIKNRFIYGNLLKSKKATSVVILLSGFSGSMATPLFKHSSKIFFKNGYSVVRFNFCNDNESLKRKDAIKLEEMKLPIYASELENIINLLRKKYSNVILVGHSFGAVISILFLLRYKKYRKSTELIFWEPSLLPWKKKWMQEDFFFDKKKKLYSEKYSKELINKIFYNECIDIKNTADIFQSLNKKACIIAVKNKAEKNAKKYFAKIRHKNTSKLIIMNGTDHSFKGKKHQKKLFDETINFLNIGNKN